MQIGQDASDFAACGQFEHVIEGAAGSAKLAISFGGAQGELAAIRLEVRQHRVDGLLLGANGVTCRTALPVDAFAALYSGARSAEKAAKANLIARREETTAMRSQANSAKLLADNPTPPSS